MTNQTLKVTLILGVLSLAAGCGQSTSEPETEETLEESRLSVFAVNYPLAYFAEILSAGDVDVGFPIPPDVDPAFWQPSPDEVIGYQQADLILLNGAGYAGWLDRVSVPTRTRVDTSLAYQDQLITLDSGPVHSHGPEGAHSHDEQAFTTWLDLSFAAAQAEAVAAALTAVLPTSATAIDKRLEQLTAELNELDAILRQTGQSLAGTPLLFSHPVYQYLARRYQLNGRALHWEPDQLPDAGEWQALDELRLEFPAVLMLWEDAPLPAIEAALAERGIRVLVFRPLGNRPAAGDFISAMRANALALEQWGRTMGSE